MYIDDDDDDDDFNDDDGISIPLMILMTTMTISISINTSSIHQQYCSHCSKIKEYNELVDIIYKTDIASTKLHSLFTQN